MWLVVDAVVYRVKAGNRGPLAELLKQSGGRSMQIRSLKDLMD